MLTAVTMRCTKRSSECKHERTQINKLLKICVWCSVLKCHEMLTAGNINELVELNKPTQKVDA